MDTTHRDAAAWAAGYVDYLRDAVGAADATRARHLPIVRRFIVACFGPDAPDWTGLSVQQVRRCCMEQRGGRKTPSPIWVHAMRMEIGRPNPDMRFKTWVATATSVFRRSSLRKRRPSPITCLYRPMAVSTRLRLL